MKTQPCQIIPDCRVVQAALQTIEPTSGSPGHKTPDAPHRADSRRSPFLEESGLVPKETLLLVPTGECEFGPHDQQSAVGSGLRASPRGAGFQIAVPFAPV